MTEIVQSMPGLWVQLLVAAAFILLASNFLAKSADIIALRTGLGRSFIGVLERVVPTNRVADAVAPTWRGVDHTV